MELNREQQYAVYSEAPKTVVMASPGSGKTQTLASRVVEIMRKSNSNIAVVTFTNAAAKEIRSRIEKLSGSPSRISCGTLHALMLRLIREYGRKYLSWLPDKITVIDEETRDEIMEYSCSTLKFKGKMADVEQAINFDFGTAMLTPAAKVASLYVHKCLSLGFLDYDSILKVGLRLLQSGCDPGITHLLVDEAQDSGDIDFEIYQAIPARSKFWVGDSDQSIYKFRGAAPRHMVSLARSDAAHLVTLDLNYRSDTAICTAANSLISHNPDRFKSVVPVSTAPGTVMLTRYNSDAEELSAIATEIQHRMATPGYNPSEVAVLNRTNHRTQAAAKMLEAFGIPVKKRRHADKPEDWEYARKVLAFCISPENDYLAHKVLSKKIGAEEANELRDDAVESMRPIVSAPQFAESVQKMADMRQNYSLDATLSLLDAFRVSSESAELVRIAAETHAVDSLDGLALALALPDSSDHDEGQGVAVLTVHGAKGREWDTVYLPAWNQEDISGASDPEDLQELRRIAFVAVTRARHELRVSYTAKRIPHANTKRLVDCQPSQFLSEMELLAK